MESKDFVTPRGNPATMLVREGTSDYNSARSCLNDDEYDLSSINLANGIGLDVGAHIGGVTIALALDNPEARVIAVEALGANVDVLRANVAANGVGDRVTVIHSAASSPKRKTARVRWNFDGGESGRHHRFIGNAQWQGDDGKPDAGEAEDVDVWSLNDLGSDVAFMKIDCELCEYDVFLSPAVKRIAEIRGEFHAGLERIVALLDATHVVTQTGGYEGTGAFTAIRR